MVKSLGDKLTDYATKPQVRDFDIENGDGPIFEHDDHDLNSESEDISSDEEAKKAHYVKVGASKLRSEQGLELNDTKYTGSKGSRNELFGDESNNAGFDHQPLVSSDANAESSENESDAVSFRTDSEDAKSVTNSDSDIELEPDMNGSSELESKREIIAKLVQQRPVLGISESLQKDAAKGYHIMQQTKEFDGILDVRIKLQKAMTAIGYMPVSKESWAELSTSNTDKLLEKNTELLNKVLRQLTDLREIFHKSNQIRQENSKSVVSKLGKKRNWDALLKQNDDLDKELKVFRQAILQKWSKKVSMASGQSALSANKFKNIQQTADVQVENQLADTVRLTKRTRLNRRGITPLNFEEDLRLKRIISTEDNAVEQNENSEDDDDADIPKNYDPRRKDGQALDTSENPYIFDDEDFYRVLLNDLIDKKISSNQSGSGNSKRITITSKANKLKKNVDTKASKGRKLNFSIQDPIANYEAPLSRGYQWSDEQIDEFFAGLLGQRVNFDELEEDTDNIAQDNEDEIKIANDDIAIFG